MESTSICNRCKFIATLHASPVIFDMLAPSLEHADEFLLGEQRDDIVLPSSEKGISLFPVKDAGLLPELVGLSIMLDAVLFNDGVACLAMDFLRLAYLVNAVLFKDSLGLLLDKHLAGKGIFRTIAFLHRGTLPVPYLLALRRGVATVVLLHCSSCLLLDFH